MTKLQALAVAQQLAAEHRRMAVVLRKPYNFDSPSPVYFAALMDATSRGQRTTLEDGTVVYVDMIVEIVGAK